MLIMQIVFCVDSLSAYRIRIICLLYVRSRFKCCIRFLTSLSGRWLCHLTYNVYPFVNNNKFLSLKWFLRKSYGSPCTFYNLVMKLFFVSLNSFLLVWFVSFVMYFILVMNICESLDQIKRSCRSLNPEPCICYVLSLPTELRSRGHHDLDLTIGKVKTKNLVFFFFQLVDLPTHMSSSYLI